MWWTTAEGNWLLTSAKNHLESGWLQVIEKWFIALMTAYSFIFEQMNSESSHHRTNRTWRWTLITGLDRHGGGLGIYWDKLTRSLTQRPSQHTQLLSSKHSLYQSDDLRRQWCSRVQSTNKMITFTDVCGCESIVSVMNHLPAQEVKDFILAQREMMTQFRGSTTVL